MKRRAVTLSSIVLPSAGLVFLWFRYHEFVYEVYAFFLAISALFLIFDWPKPDWLNGQQPAKARQKWGRKDLHPTIMRVSRHVSDLSQLTVVGRYFIADTREKDTKEICSEIRTNLMGKGIAYGVTTLFLLFVLPRNSSAQPNATDDNLLGILKAWAVFSTFALLAVWDVAVCRLHSSRNRLVNDTDD